MTPEATRYLAKARYCLNSARAILAINLGDDAGRSAYLAGFHAAQAFIYETTGKISKTHNGVQGEFYKLAQNNPNIPSNLLSFLPQAYHLKAVADYETGEGSIVPLDQAAAAIETANQLIDCIAAILNSGRSDS